MKVRVDKSMGIVTRIPEALARIKPTEPLRLVNRFSGQDTIFTISGAPRTCCLL